MSISGIEDILPRYQEISNGSKKEFIVNFELINTKFVNVYLGSDKQNSGFNIDIENKKITFESAPSSGSLVTIVRAVPASWESELHGALNSEGLNSLVTHIMASIQTIKEEVSRAIKSNVYDQNEGGQLSEFFLKQLTDAQDILDRSENNLELLTTTAQTSLSSISNLRDETITDINNLLDSAKKSEQNASASASEAKASEENAQQIVDSIVNNAADRNLSNLTSTGQAKFDAKQDKLTSSNAGTGISISNGIISNTQTSAEWGKIKGDLSSQKDLQAILDSKMDVSLTNISTEGQSVIQQVVDNKIRVKNQLPDELEEAIIYFITG